VSPQTSHNPRRGTAGCQQIAGVGTHLPKTLSQR
jgi:hypothetical protein